MANRNNTPQRTRNYANTKRQPSYLAPEVEPAVEEEVSPEVPEVETEVATEPEVKKAKVHGVDTGLRLRKSPSVRGDVESILKPEVELVILEELGDWTKVKVEATGLVGYVMTQFIEVV